MPLINDVMVVSETCGTENERSYWKGGIVFVPQNKLALTLTHYLENGSLRDAVAVKAKQMLQKIKFSEALREPLQHLVRGRCENWRAVGNNQQPKLLNSN